MPQFGLPEVDVSVRTLIALVFLTAAAGKLRHLDEFKGVVANYRLLPSLLVTPVALALPPLEGVVAVALPLRWASPGAEAAAALLLLTFAAAMGINLLKGRRDIDCGCFQSALKQTLNWRLVARNVLLALLLVPAAASPAGLGSAWALAEGVLVGSVCFLILQSLNILWSIVPAWGTRRPVGPGAAA